MILSFSAYTRELMVAILDAEERTGSAQIDLVPACEAAGLEWSNELLIRFLNEQNDVTGSGTGLFEMYSFALNSAGRERAEQIRRARLPKTLIERLTGETSQKLVNVLNFAVATLALIVATIAVLK